MVPYYQDDLTILYLADCRDVIPTLDGISVVVTDPPYSSGARRDSDRQTRGKMLRGKKDPNWFSHDTMTTWGMSWFLRSVFSGMRACLVPGGHVYCFTDWRMTPTVYGMLEATGYRVNHCLVWDKEHFGLGGWWRNQHENIVFASLGKANALRNRGAGSVLKAKTVSSQKRLHPTEKPVSLLSHILMCSPGGLVMDPFCGSGSTLVAAKSVEARSIGIELEEKYCEVAAKRLEQKD